MTFSKEQIKMLQQPLAAEKVAERQGPGGRKLSYIETWDAIDTANKHFGFDAWNRELVWKERVNSSEVVSGDKSKKIYMVSYVATVRVTVGSCVREGTGAGHGKDRDLGMAHESAIKEAESDATKRALMTFGYQFGLALYDKTRQHVVEVAAKYRDKRTLPVDALGRVYAKVGEHMDAEQAQELGEPEAVKISIGEAALLYDIADSVQIEDGEKMFTDPTTGELYTQKQFIELAQEKLR